MASLKHSLSFPFLGGGGKETLSVHVPVFPRNLGIRSAPVFPRNLGIRSDISAT